MKHIQQFIKQALQEDIGTEDWTSVGIPEEVNVTAEIVVKQSGVLAGIEIAEEVFSTVDSTLSIEKVLEDGHMITIENKYPQVMTISGSARSILKAERVALNFLQHLSGIATLTAQFVEKVKGSNIKIRDTRKTIPGLRELEKYAVRMGGGENHRMRLDDGILIKDNHWQLCRELKVTMQEYVATLREKIPKSLWIEIEAKTLEEVKEALVIQPDVILLDNMDLSLLQQAISLIEGKCKIELSGGVNLETIDAVKHLPIDYIAIGALTHSAPVLDLSLEILA